jgi:hypothetical protein
VTGTFLAKFLPALLLGAYAGTCQRAVVDESGIIISQMGHTIHQKMVAVHGTLCTIPHRNSYQYTVQLRFGRFKIEHITREIPLLPYCS